MEPIISLTTEPELLIESEETLSSLNFNFSEISSESEIYITVNSPNLSEFNLNSIQVEGGELNLNSEIQALLETSLSEKVTPEIPGVAIAITTPLGNWSEAAGISNLENDTPLTTSDRFQIGSITKTFTATTLLKLVEADLLTLEDKITDWLPETVTENISNSNEITIRQLLNHTSGIAEYDVILLPQAQQNPLIFFRDWQPEEILDLINGVEPFFEPGEGWQYSNTNYILAGMIIEAATNNNIAAEIRTQILEPLNLENTFFAEEEEIPGGYISGYLDFDGDGILDDISVANISWAWANGAMVSTTEDLTQFAKALYTGELLSEDSLAEMFTVVDTGQGYSYGLGMMSFETADLGTVIGHRGGTLGFNANMWYSAEDDFTYIDLANGRANERLVDDTIPAFRTGVIPTVGNTIAYDEFDFTMTEADAQISFSVVNDGENEGEEIASFTIEPGEGYEVNSDVNSGLFTIIDSIEPTSTTVALITGPDFLIEAAETVSAHVFNITAGTLPEDGLVVSVNAPHLNEFDLEKIEIINGEIVDVRPDGFDLRLTDFTTLINLPITDDGEIEGLETASFTLEAGTGYEVNPNFSSGEFTIVDTTAELPPNISNPNDIIPLASNIELSSENPQVTITDEIGFEIGNRYLNQDGSFTYVDASEDVDFYQVDLKAGDIVAFDIDATVVNDTLTGFLRSRIPGNTVLQLFDEAGNVLVSRGLGPAAGELFVSDIDPSIEFQAPEDGTYYLGVSGFTNGLPYRFGGGQFGDPEAWAERAYDPFIPGSGDASNSFIWIGEYQLNVTLNPDNPALIAEQRDRSNNTPPETIDIPQPGEPTVSLDFISGIYDTDDSLLGNQLIEGLPNQGSILTLVVNVDGEIPEEGIVVDLNSDIYLRDYFTTRSLIRPPFTPGAETVGILTDDTGRETGLQLRVFESATYLPLNARTQVRGELLTPETDGPEDATFFLEDGEGYGVSEAKSQFTTTFYDNLDQAPNPTIIPEVSFSMTETELIESNETETTLNFSLSEPPPEEGVLVYVQGENAGILSQFDVLSADIDGGVFPFPNFNFSGFFFKITEQEASITVSTFADPFLEGRQSFNLGLQEAPLYTINPDQNRADFTISDTPDSQLEVSLRAESEVLVEAENPTSLLTFNLTAIPPEDGITVSVEAPNLSEFEADAIAITGGEITNLTETGFSLNITDITATVEFPVLSDSESEGLETATFTLVETENSIIDPDANEATFTLVDVPEQVPTPPQEFKLNDTIAEAIDLNLNPQNPNGTISGGLTGLEPGQERPSGTDFSEDVDIYSFEVEAGDTVTIDIDTTPFPATQFGDTLYEGIEQQTDAELRLFDADGNELAYVGSGAEPGEALSRDPYLEFTAPETGQYYIGISQLGNRDYDPNIQGGGSGWIFPEIGIFAGEYELNVSLTPATDIITSPTDGNDTLEGSEDDDLIAGLLGDDTLMGNDGDEV
ncbi:MAG: serine hydrolase [Cyanobacteria bacterium J06592_8]